LPLPHKEARIVFTGRSFRYPYGAFAQCRIGSCKQQNSIRDTVKIMKWPSQQRGRKLHAECKVPDGLAQYGAQTRSKDDTAT
jgi:hypothetical protein